MKKALLPILLCLMILLSSCGTVKYELPDGAQVLTPVEIYQQDDPDDTYTAVSYNGKVYTLFGTLQGDMKDVSKGECVGCIYDESQLVITLDDDEDGNFIMVYNASGESDPDFWRSIDTCGEDIEIPSYISDMNIEFWN